MKPTILRLIELFFLPLLSLFLWLNIFASIGAAEPSESLLTSSSMFTARLTSVKRLAGKARRFAVRAIMFGSASSEIIRVKVCVRNCAKKSGYRLKRTRPKRGQQVTLLVNESAAPGSTDRIRGISLPYGNATPKTTQELVPSELATAKTIQGDIYLSLAANTAKKYREFHLFLSGREVSVWNITPGSATVTFKWDSSTIVDGIHDAQIAAVTEYGELSLSPVVRTLVANEDVDPPVVSVSKAANPIGALSTDQSFRIIANDTRDGAKLLLTFSVDGVQLETPKKTGEILTIDTRALSNRDHTLLVTAQDAAGNIGRSSIVVFQVNNIDRTPPTVTLVGPAPGIVTNGKIELIAQASDDVALSLVYFYIDGVQFRAISSGPTYTYVPDLLNLVQGEHRWKVVVYDSSSNLTISAERNFFIEIPDVIRPTCTIESPASGATVSGTAQIQVTASDNKSISKVNLLVDGIAKSTGDFMAPYTFDLNTNSLEYGSHTIEAEAVDGAGNKSLPCAAKINVDNRPAAVLTLDTGSSANVSPPTLQFSFTEMFTSVDKTFTVRYSGGRPATFREISGLGTAFHYKGGSFPGVGGTCRSAISSDCTIVLSFTPDRGAGSITVGDSTGRFLSIVDLNYFDGLNERSTPLRLVGRSTVPLPVAVNFSRNFGVVRPGVEEQRSIVLSRSSLSPIRAVSVSAVASPFVQVSQNCDGFESTESICELVYGISPSAKEGEYEQQLTLRYFDGVTRHEKSFILRARIQEVRAADNLLVVYNRRSAAGVQLKDRYLKTRPTFSSATTLAIDFPSNCSAPCPEADGEFSSLEEFQRSIQQPILSWFKEHPGHQIRHVVLMYGIPTRISGGPASIAYYLADSYRLLGTCLHKWYHWMPLPENAVCDRLASSLDGGLFAPDAYPGTTALFTHLYMGSEAATAAYIEKLRSASALLPAGKEVLSGSLSGLGGSTYYLEDVGSVYPAEQEAVKRAALLATMNPSPSIVLKKFGEQYISNANDVRAFFTWGSNGGRGGDYALNGNLVFSGKSSWFLMMSAESFNGQRSVFQGNFVDWFSEKAFGGLQYKNTPIGAVGHVEEPYLSGVNSGELFTCWEGNQLFADCAWKSMRSMYDTVFGDPWVTK